MAGSDRKVILAHGLDGQELANLELLGHQLISVDDTNGGALIRDILEDKTKATAAKLPPEKVVIFNGYSDAQLKEGVVAIRANFKDRPIIAAVTEHSYNWPFEYLLREHLIKDRDWNLKNAREYQANLLEENEAQERRKEAETKAAQAKAAEKEQ